MCGITGFIDHQQIITEAHLKEASSAIQHRGGDGSKLFIDKKEHYTVGLANELLATLDLSDKAQQPLSSSCGNYIITFNGSIYNHLELRESLIKYGVIFSTLTDTEVILECYKKWGHKAFERFDGSYALAILDRKQHQLLVVRDEIGTKPLYFYKSKGFYAFASELRALLCYPPVEKKLNKGALAGYFRYGYFDGEQTIYQQLFKQKKGIITIIDLHSGNSYDMPILRPQLPPAITENLGEAEIVAKIEELLTESILKRNLADVPTGVLLSGGYDSSTVAAILQKNQSKRIKTFTVGFKEQKFDEAPAAKKIAEHLKTNHHEFYLDQTEALQILKKLPEIFDEPIGDSTAIPLAFIAEKANKEVKILLGAEGGDELFGGYRTYTKALELTEFEQRKPGLLKTLQTKFWETTQPKMKEILATAGLLPKYLAVNAYFTTAEITSLLKENIEFPAPPKNNAVSIKGLLIHDLQHYLPNSLLLNSDRCFMHHGVANRDAILKTELVDYLTTLDPKWFIKDGQQKYLLKKITHQYIPAQLMTKPKKGFVIPLAAWLKTTFKPLVIKYLSAESLNQHQLFDTNEVEKIKRKFYRNSSLANAQKIWLLLQFQMWYEKWMVGVGGPEVGKSEDMIS